MIIEIRTYRLRSGERDEFVRVMREESAPLVARFGIEVLDAGPSLVDEDGEETAYLIRSFSTLEVREAQENAFYSSPQWREGPREAIVSRIESMHTVVFEAPPDVAATLRQRTTRGTPWNA